MYEITNVVLPDGKTGVIGVHGLKIAYVRTDDSLQRSHEKVKVMDGRGYLLLPGGIDPHVHFRCPGWEQKETWESGSRAALAGGITTVFDMPNTPKPLTSQEALASKIELISAAEPEVDYRLWFGATPTNHFEFKHISAHSKVIGVKVYMGSSTGDLLVAEDSALYNIFHACASRGLPVGVHAEDEKMIRQTRAAWAGEARVADHCFIRSSAAEIRAVERALAIQAKTGCVLYFCHLSVPRSLELVMDAKEKGATVYAEVCPHHFYLTCESGRASAYPGYYKVNPPLRTEEERSRFRELVCRNGFVDTFGSDHAPHQPSEKEKRAYDDVPSGIPGVQTIFPLMYDLVSMGQITVAEFVARMSGNAARIFGLSNKGQIKQGCDADLVLLDPNALAPHTADQMYSRMKWTPYAGQITRGQIKAVVTRGRFVWL